VPLRRVLSGRSLRLTGADPRSFVDSGSQAEARPNVRHVDSIEDNVAFLAFFVEDSALIIVASTIVPVATFNPLPPDAAAAGDPRRI
jgi:hypothetical protein